MWRDVTWLTLTHRGTTRRLWSCRLICLIHTCDATYSYVTWRDSQAVVVSFNVRKGFGFLRPHGGSGVCFSPLTCSYLLRKEFVLIPQSRCDFILGPLAFPVCVVCFPPLTCLYLLRKGFVFLHPHSRYDLFLWFFFRPLALPMCVGCFFGVKEMSLGEASWASIFWKYDAYFFGSVGGRLYGETHFLLVGNICVYVICVYHAFTVHT